MDDAKLSSLLSSTIDWAEIGDLVCTILVKVRENLDIVEQRAKREGVTVEQLSAAAIAQALREHIEGMEGVATRR